MSAFPDPDPGEQDWQEWSPWDEMELLERYERRNNDWVAWLGRLLAVALILPSVLAFLVIMLIWLF